MIYGKHFKYEPPTPNELASQKRASPLPSLGSQSCHSFYLILFLGPTAALRDYIALHVNQELTQLRLSVDQRIRTTEEKFNTKLVQLEKGSGAGKGGGKGKKK